MLDKSEPVLDWLKRQRRTNEVQLGLMAHRFDLDGAMASGQVELAWRTREVILIAGIELHLRMCGLDPSFGTEHATRAQVMLRLLGTLDQSLADQAWGLLVRVMPLDRAGLERELEEIDSFLTHRLSVRSAQSRGEAVRVWADGVKLLRDVGRSLGLAGTDRWYLRSSSGLANQLTWYDEAIDFASQQS